MIRGAVEVIPPAIVTVSRLWIGTIFLYIVMKQAGRTFPPLLDTTKQGIRLTAEWRWMLSIAFIGYVLPFFIFPWAQQFIPSGLAGVYMAFMPIWTIVLAYFFANESLGPQKIIGVALGFVGIMILMGPEVIKGAAASSVLAQAALLIASICYAASAVLTRRAPNIRPRVFATGTLLCASIISTPALFFTPFETDQWTLVGVANVVGLGLGPTGLAGVLLIIIIQRVGAGFMGLANYVTPLWAVMMGALFFNERLEVTVFVALIIILAGVAVSQRNSEKASSDK